MIIAVLIGIISANQRIMNVKRLPGNQQMNKKQHWLNYIWLFRTNIYICKKINPFLNMFWTLELASHLEDAPWPATKDELIDYSIRSGAPIEVIENLQELEDEGEIYEGLDDIWPDYPSQEDFFFNEDEY